MAIGATSTVPLFYDFYGFPQRFYEQQYAAPGAPELAASVRALLSDVETVVDQPTRGLDHGAYVPLAVMFPNADIPVLQISMPSMDPQRLFRVGEKLRTLRDEGVLIMGSGFLTHGLPYLDWSGGLYQAPPAWSKEFDDWAQAALATGDISMTLSGYISAQAFLANGRMRAIAMISTKRSDTMPDLPTANYSVWVRGYGLVDSPKVLAKPGQMLDLRAIPAPDAASAAHYYPALYWFSMLKIPDAKDFPGTGPNGNGMAASLKDQGMWLRQLKTDGCVACHQLGDKATRELPAALEIGRAHV